MIIRVIAGFLALLALVVGCGDWGGPGQSKPQPPPSPIKVAPFALGKPDVVLLITGRTGGILELCNCSGPMPGGLSRRSGIVISYRHAFERTLLVDSGDVFWIEPDSLRNDYVLKGYAQIGYDAITMGDQEWAASPARLRQLLGAQAMPFLSTGVSLADDVHKLSLLPEVTRQWGGLKIAVLSDVGKESMLFLGKEVVGGLEFKPGEFAARAGRLKSEGYVIVAVAHTDEDGTARLARSGLADLVIRGHSARSEEHPLDADGNTWTPASRGAPIIKVGGSDVVGAVAMKVFGGRITALELRVEAGTEHWPADQRLLQTYQAYAHAAMREALDAQRKSGLEYVPSSECGRCHQAQYKNWNNMRHSRAYKTLTDAGRQGDPNCLMCHTSGFGTSKGFYTIKDTPQLANVNCQDCHRFNIKEHRQAGFKAPQPNEDVCTSCHTAVTDPKFQFEAKKAIIACPKR